MIIFWLRKRHYCQFQTKNVLPEQAFLAIHMGNMQKIINEIHSCINCETPVNATIVYNPCHIDEEIRCMVKQPKSLLIQ